MIILKRLFVLCLALLLCVMPMVSCAKEEEKKTEEKKTEEVTKEDKKTEDEKTEKIPAVLKGVEVDPLFYGQDPSEDEELNILLIGNSYSYYWLDELWGLLDAAGYENVRVCDVYYSGCKFYQHWEWYEKGEANYVFQIYESVERRTWENVGLEECMVYANWDFIGFQQSGTYMYGKNDGPDTFKASVEKDLPNLYRLMYQNFPQAEYCWVQHWVHEVGTSNKEGLGSQESQDFYADGYKEVASEICPEFGFTNVPLGDAWQAIRHDPIFYEAGNGDYPKRTLHTRIYNSKFVSMEEISNEDLSHDGDIGGGQYVNGCVWFEVITHRSVVGNSFRPEYKWEQQNKILTLTEEQITKIQNAAHEAVLGCHGEDWYA